MNDQPDISAQVQQLTQQNNTLQSQLLQLITTSTLKNNETTKPDAYIVLIEDSAAACPITGRTLEIPPNISRQAIKFVIEPEWTGVINAFTKQQGFRALKSEYNFVGCILLFGEEDDEQFINGAIAGLWDEIKNSFNAIPTVCSLPKSANLGAQLLQIRQHNENFMVFDNKPNDTFAARLRSLLGLCGAARSTVPVSGQIGHVGGSRGERGGRGGRGARGGRGRGRGNKRRRYE